MLLADTPPPTPHIKVNNKNIIVGILCELFPESFVSYSLMSD